MLHIVNIKNRKTYVDDVINNAQNGDTILFNKGNYYVKTSIKILNKKNITLRGITGNPSDVSITQIGTVRDDNGKKIYLDGIAITSSDYITLDSITFMVERKKGIPVCLSVNGCTHVQVVGCRFYANKNTFAVYFSGPTDIKGETETLDAYYNDELPQCNTFEKNIVVSEYDHDGLVFGLQSNGTLRNNIVYGCRIAVYMVRDTLAHGNYVYDSASNGIACSLPSHNLNVTNNVIERSVATGIRLTTQLEHGATDADDFHINIVNNRISDCLNGIDVEESYNVSINKNKITNCRENGVTTVDVRYSEIGENIITNCNVGINICRKTMYTNVYNNTIYNYLVDASSNNGILIDKNTCHNFVRNNEININNPTYGDIGENTFIKENTTDDIDNVNMDIGNTIENNIIKNCFDFYSHLIMLNSIQ